ncbi:MAG TPA: hypothetical protein VMI11_06325 [Actinomycetes bacterium]|nr:hypothetical protein [Actinomycetes bacterium]
MTFLKVKAGFRWDKWAEGLLCAVASAALPVALSALLDHRVTQPEWYGIATMAVTAGVAWIKDHRPQVVLPAVPPELVAVWEEHRAQLEKLALEAVVAELRKTPLSLPKP